jgi:hypothetical protein
MSTKAKAIETNPLSVLGDALESAAETFGEATTNARKSAKAAAKSAQKNLATGTYKAAYGVSYGLVYATVFLTELLPEDNILRRGFEEGAEAALEAASKKESAAKPSTKGQGEEEDRKGLSFCCQRRGLPPCVSGSDRQLFKGYTFRRFISPAERPNDWAGSAKVECVGSVPAPPREDEGENLRYPY